MNWLKRLLGIKQELPTYKCPTCKGLGHYLIHGVGPMPMLDLCSDCHGHGYVTLSKARKIKKREERKLWSSCPYH